MSEEAVTLDDFGGLAALANIDMGAVDEYRAGPIPLGTYVFEVTSAELNTQTVSKSRDEPDEKVNSAVVNVVAKIVGVVNFKGVAPDKRDALQEVTVGREYRENFLLGRDTAEFQKGVGALKAFLKDATGHEPSGALQDVIASAVGIQFEAAISHRADREDKDKVYSRMNRDKVKPYGA